MLVIANKREAQCLDCEESFLMEKILPEENVTVSKTHRIRKRE